MLSFEYFIYYRVRQADLYPNIQRCILTIIIVSHEKKKKS